MWLTTSLNWMYNNNVFNTSCNNYHSLLSTHSTHCTQASMYRRQILLVFCEESFTQTSTKWENKKSIWTHINTHVTNFVSTDDLLRRVWWQFVESCWNLIHTTNCAFIFFLFYIHSAMWWHLKNLLFILPDSEMLSLQVTVSYPLCVTRTTPQCT